MYISPRTVDTYRNRLMGKLELHSLADVVRTPYRRGWSLSLRVAARRG